MYKSLSLVNIAKILVIILLLLLITRTTQANNNYKVFLVKNQYFAVDFKENTNKIKLIFPGGKDMLLSRKKSALGDKYNSGNINFFNKEYRAQISFNDIIIDAKTKEYSEEINRIFPELKADEYIFFKIQGFYIFFSDNMKNKIVISGREVKINKVSDNIYKGEELEIFEDDNSLTLKLNNYKFRAQSVNLNDFIKDNNLVLKGLGQEPGWLASIKNKNIKLKLDYKQTILNISPSQYEIDIKKNEICYKVKTSLFNFDIIITKNVHSDIMSGFKFPFTIKIISKKNTLTGGAYLKELN